MLKNLQILRGYLFPNVHIYIGLRIRVQSSYILGGATSSFDDIFSVGGLAI